MKYFLLLFASCVLASCQTRMNIQGTTDVALLEGKMLYLRAFAVDDLTTLDSARVTHGRFHFTGSAPDSTVFASLFIEDESVMPVVLDNHPLTVTLNENERRVVGSELNDSLCAFIRRKTSIDRQLAELPRRESRMILEGMDHDEILMQLNREASLLSDENAALVTRFIKSNMDNVLGPGVFMVVTSGFPYPVLNPQIEELITLASPFFLNDAYVREYVRIARENMERMSEE